MQEQTYVHHTISLLSKFLAEAFGFRKYGVQMRRPDGKINHAEMKFGDDLIMMGYPGPKYRHFGIYWCVFAVW